MPNTTGSMSYGVTFDNQNITSMDVVHKFGRNLVVGTTQVPISIGGVYRTPQVSSATTLRVKAGGDANDTAAGTGARELTLVGLDETGAEVTETLATAGTGASTATTVTFMRLYRLFVSASGTYATTAIGSAAGDIVIEDSAGTEDWATIDATNYPVSQSEIACYTVPLGKKAYITDISYSTSATKILNITLMQRQNILDAAASYSAMRELYSFVTIVDQKTRRFDPYLGQIPPLTDLICLAEVSSTTAELEVEFTILLIDE